MSGYGLQGKVVIITGATTGIGQAAAIEFAKHGTKLVLCGRNQDGLNNTKKQCVKQGILETDTAIVTGDILLDETLDLIVSTTLDKFGRVDVLFLNAAKAPIDGTVLTADSIEGLDYSYEIFIKSPYKLTQKLSSELIKTKGAIVINSSITSQEWLVPGHTPYSIFKAAQDQMTRLFALTFANKGVRVNAVRPGIVETNILSDRMVDPTTGESLIPEALYSTFGSYVPLEGGLSAAEDIGRVVVFLASSQSACMTGTLLTADKGLNMTHPAVDWKQF